MGKRGKQGWKKVYLPVGTIRCRRRKKSSKNGAFIEVRFIKVRDTLPKATQWIPLAKHTWEVMHGPVPKGKRVVHLDGNSLNDNPANYGLMTAGEVIKACHTRDLAMSRENRQGLKRREAVQRHNRDRGLVFRAHRFVSARWYAFNATTKRVLDRPLRSRRQVAALFGVAIAVNGIISRRRLAELGLEFRRGRDMEHPPREWKWVQTPEELRCSASTGTSSQRPGEELSTAKGAGGWGESTTSAGSRVDIRGKARRGATESSSGSWSAADASNGASRSSRAAISSIYPI